MSLICNECREEMGPGKILPGREGTMVHPVVMALAYLPTKDGVSYKSAYLRARENASLCFRCIDNKLPPERREALKKIYTAYEEETRFGALQEEQKGKWQGPDEPRHWLKAYKKFKRSLGKLEKGCLFCSSDVQTGKPFFNARVIDRVYSGKHLSGFTIPDLTLGHNYSCSNLREGQTSFKVCFDDFRINFPNTFAMLSYLLTGEENPDVEPVRDTLYLSPEFEEAFERETGKSMDEGLRKFLEGIGDIRIIRRER